MQHSVRHRLLRSSVTRTDRRIAKKKNTSVNVGGTCTVLLGASTRHGTSRAQKSATTPRKATTWADPPRFAGLLVFVRRQKRSRNKSMRQNTSDPHQHTARTATHPPPVTHRQGPLLPFDGLRPTFLVHERLRISTHPTGILDGGYQSGQWRGCPGGRGTTQPLATRAKTKKKKTGKHKTCFDGERGKLYEHGRAAIRSPSPGRVVAVLQRRRQASYSIPQRAPLLQSS